MVKHSIERNFIAEDFEMVISRGFKITKTSGGFTLSTEDGSNCNISARLPKILDYLLFRSSLGLPRHC